MLKADPEMRLGFWAGMEEVPEGLEWAWRAFWALSPSRQLGFGDRGAIPFEPIDRYADRYRIEDFEEFHTLIQAMDAVYLKHFQERS